MRQNGTIPRSFFFFFSNKLHHTPFPSAIFIFYFTANSAATMKCCSSLAKSQLLTVLFFGAAGCCLAQAQSPAAESLSVIATNDFTCRMEPQLDYCGLPLYLANFQVISGVGTASCSFPPDHNVWLTSIFNLFYFNHTGQPQMRRWCQNWPSCKR